MVTLFLWFLDRFFPVKPNDMTLYLQLADDKVARKLERSHYGADDRTNDTRPLCAVASGVRHSASSQAEQH